MRSTNKFNILGISFGEDDKMKIIEWPVKENEKIRTSKKKFKNK